jgi:creatinine amidohydrolase
LAAYWEDLSWPEVEEAAQRNAVVIVPLGAIEQHGPHLRVDHDAYLARTLAHLGAGDRDVLVAPQLPFGYRSRQLSGGGLDFPGTISLSGSTLVTVVREVLEEVFRQNFTRVMLYNCHGENSNFCFEAAWLASGHRTDVKVVVMEFGFAFSQETMDLLYGGDFPGWPAEHASIMETSIMLALRPEAVNMSKAVDDEVKRRPPYELIPFSSELTTRSGVLWKATQATKEKGQRVLEETLALLGEVLDREFFGLSGQT